MLHFHIFVFIVCCFHFFAYFLLLFYQLAVLEVFLYCDNLEMRIGIIFGGSRGQSRLGGIENRNRERKGGNTRTEKMQQVLYKPLGRDKYEGRDNSTRVSFLPCPISLSSYSSSFFVLVWLFLRTNDKQYFLPLVKRKSMKT